MTNHYEALPLAALREAAKEKGLKGITALRKQELIDLLIKSDSETEPEPIKQKEPTIREKKIEKVIEQDNSEDKSKKKTEEKTFAMETVVRESQKEDESSILHKDKSYEKTNNNYRTREKASYIPTDMEQLDSGETKEGILEVMPDGYGFIRCDNFLPGENDVYVSPAQIRRFNLKTGDIVAGNTRVRSQNEKFSALLYVKNVNGFSPIEAQRRKRFEDLTPIFPDERIHLETPRASLAMRMVDLISPIGKGQRGMIVSQPKTGKTTLLKQIAKAITTNYKDMHLIILLIDERPEEVTDIKESIQGNNVEVIYSTFDELP